MAGQFVAVLHATEDEVGMLALQSASFRSVPDPDEAGARVGLPQAPVCPDGKIEVFFRRNPADMEGNRIVRASAPLRAQRRVAAVGGKAVAVDRPRQAPHLPEAL